ncbi:MAG: glycine cleavage system aminomethyltransferase GcvT [bacterium]|nr:glycine cleavage system aminomethyltransferase GcvT [bacterium]MDD3804873.1 glycine cleavage system aminomethyltransferase GcvT [bacterium]MDD4152671.1 glycine cleavage system aminomethyltransferase GcvT [bacterium]MDD4557777.1 glycine cleavage system aminomethyltransferase GcvT [bacterium]
MSELRKTPLNGMHKEARLVDYAGWEMPVYYSGILEEHMAVRQMAGMFDVSHMAKIMVEGPEAIDLLQLCLTNNIALIAPGRAIYSLMCNPQGGVIDDLIVYRFSDESYMVVANAVNEQSVYYWLKGHLPDKGVSLRNLTDNYALIALQGPIAAKILKPLMSEDPADMKYFDLAFVNLLGRPCVITRTGYTGEDGFELFLHRSEWSIEQIEDLWEHLAAGGAKPCGLGARDNLRIEAGYPLYGHELSETINPLQAGMGWAVKFNKGDFIGRAALECEDRTEPVELLVGFKMLERSVPRQGYPIFSGEEQVGHVTSGAYSPIRKEDIGMAYVLEPYASAGIRLEAQVRQRRLPLEIMPKPFIEIKAGKAENALSPDRL